MKIAALLVFPVLFACTPALAGDQCRPPAEAAIFAERLTFAVAGTGRLHFHSGPHADCLNKKVFVVPGDELVANQVAGDNDEWVQVTYTDKREHDHIGWVRAGRLKFTGASGTNMTPAKHAHYTKAAAAAKAGKLGLP